MQQRYEDVMDACAELARRGHVPFSPIAHWHPIAQRHKLPTDAKFWEDYNMCVLLRCDSLIILQLEGWRESVGVEMEIKFAESNGIPSYTYEEFLLLP